MSGIEQGLLCALGVWEGGQEPAPEGVATVPCISMKQCISGLHLAKLVVNIKLLSYQEASHHVQRLPAVSSLHCFALGCKSHV